MGKGTNLFETILVPVDFPRSDGHSGLHVKWRGCVGRGLLFCTSSTPALLPHSIDWVCWRFRPMPRHSAAAYAIMPV